MGLLVTKKVGAHYRFTESDSKEIEKIMELKQLDFSLQQIQEILCFRRLVGEQTDEYRKYCISVLENKRDQIEREQQRYKQIDHDINHRISKFKAIKAGESETLGLSMSSMNMLCCPDCKGILNIYNGTIEKNMIINANVRCECNYIAIIENGIYIDESAVREKTLNGKSMPSKKEYLDAASSKFINFYSEGMVMLIDNIEKYNNGIKYILEIENCVGNFLMQYIDYLPKDSTYILIDHDKNRISNLKNNLELHFNHNKFIFFCCDIDRLPIVDSSVDLIIDHWMTKNYGLIKNRFLPEVFSPLLKDGGILVGTYPYFDIKSKDYYNLPIETRNYYNRDKLLEKLDNLDYIRTEVEAIGPIVENNPYNLDIKDKELYCTIYAGQKKGK
jgi:DNA-binding transcriptional MerR regulator/uncharacterized protein YbaR (Trm112 family)/ubiquinone/menaquinone biosynthesis C-methylase UbiE